MSRCTWRRQALAWSTNCHEFAKWPQHVSQLFLFSCREFSAEYFCRSCVIASKGPQVQQVWFGVGEDAFNTCLRGILTSTP